MQAAPGDEAPAQQAAASVLGGASALDQTSAAAFGVPPTLQVGDRHACLLNSPCAGAGTCRSRCAMCVDTRLRLVSMHMGYLPNPVTQAHPDPPELATAGNGADDKANFIGKHV